MSKYNPDISLSQLSSFLTRSDIKPDVDSGKISVKSYTFLIKNPKSEDASTSIKNDEIWKTIFSGRKYDSQRNVLGSYPTAGNYHAISKFINIPNSNPKDGKRRI